MSKTTKPSAMSEASSMQSTYDMGFGESDVESSSSDTNEATVVPKDYWFGRKYFECVMAQDLLHCTSLHEGMADIDSKLEILTRELPYAEILKKLSAETLGPLLPTLRGKQSEAYFASMAGIGAIVRKGNRDQKAALLVTLRQHSPTAEGQDKSSAVTDTGQDDWQNPPHHYSASNGNLPASSLGQYAMALQHDGDQHGFVPEYVIQNVSTSPPQTRAIVSFKGFSFEGIARNKKQARHLAAREACNFLKIHI